MLDGLDDHDSLRADLAAVYRTLRDIEGDALAAVVRDRAPQRAGRLLRVLQDLGLAAVDAASGTVRVSEQPADVGASPAFRALLAIAQEQRSWLTRPIAQAA